MRFIIYIIIALFMAFEAVAQGNSPETNPLRPTSDTEIFPLSVTEEAAEANTTAIEAEPDVFPQLNGGPTDFLHYVSNNMQYPESALRDGKQGKVMVLVTVGADGIPRNPEILEGVRDDLDAEALRLVNEMPAWYPAEKNGKKVATKAVVVVPFTIQKNPEPFK